MSMFYAEQVGYCQTCGGPATHLVRGPRNDSYGYACAKHVRARVAHLTRVHAPSAEEGEA